MAEEIFYEDVNYKGKPGSLTLSDMGFHYQANNTKTSVKCSWARVEKRQLSPEKAKQHMIKLVMVSGKTVIFTVENRAVFEELRNDMQHRMDAAKTRTEDPKASSSPQTRIEDSKERVTYNPDYVKKSKDNAEKAMLEKDMKGASEELQKALKNLKLCPNHEFSQLESANKHEAKGDTHFKQKEFRDAYQSYHEAINALETEQFSKTKSCLAMACVPCILICVVSGVDPRAICDCIGCVNSCVHCLDGCCPAAAAPAAGTPSKKPPGSESIRRT